MTTMQDGYVYTYRPIKIAKSAMFSSVFSLPLLFILKSFILLSIEENGIYSFNQKKEKKMGKSISSLENCTLIVG